MRLVQATGKTVVIWLVEEETPSRWGITALVRTALEGAGLPPWPHMRAELFAAGGDVLVIARPAPARIPPRRRRPALARRS